MGDQRDPEALSAVPHILLSVVEARVRERSRRAGGRLGAVSFVRRGKVAESSPRPATGSWRRFSLLELQLSEHDVVRKRCHPGNAGKITCIQCVSRMSCSPLLG